MLGATELSAIAKLARLHLDAAEQHELAGELTDVLAHMAVLAAVNTEGIAPMIYGAAPHAGGEAANTSGGDTVAEDVLPVAVAVGGAAVVRAGQFVVPNVMPERP
ncbi:MAG: hypothetical protein IPL79_14185 [Myxococcales bacterium]|nr:hypothetical protein [Myxococcales bacterium]